MSSSPSQAVASYDPRFAPAAPARESQHSADRKQAHDHPGLARCLRAVRERTGKGFLAQVREIASLAFGPGRLTVDEYYAFQLYDDRFSAEDKRRFVSDSQFHAITEKTCHPAWRAITSDKIVSDALLESFGIQVPTLVAVFAPGFREAGVPVLRTGGELASFLRRTRCYPLFAKQVNGVQSWGAWYLRSYDPLTDTLRLLDGRDVPVSEIAGEIASIENGEYLIQKAIVPHPAVARVTGTEGISTVRVVTILEENGPVILGAVWKIAAGGNPADNFWRRGNMLAALDGAGKVTRVIRGTGPDMEELATHPDTGAGLVGFELPHWELCRAMALRSASFFPKLGFSSFDIALGDLGPVMVEINSGSAFNLFQLAYGQGFMTDRFQRFYRTWEHAKQPP